jgi:nucleoside-diphosphate-sugar epimerase
LVTGATGFLGRHLLAALKKENQIFAVARGTPEASGAPRGPTIDWIQADVVEISDLERVEEHIRSAGGIDLAIHLAAYYDFTGRAAPDYQLTNVEGTRNVLDLLDRLAPRHLLFASSVAACGFTRPGFPVTELSLTDGTTHYAISKRRGEKLVLEHQGPYTISVVRFAALFSDWCQYEPLYHFLSTWLSSSWRRRILSGGGQAAIPFLHIFDAVTFVLRLLDRYETLDPREVLIAAPNSATSHAELHSVATACHFGRRLKAIHVPRLACRMGILALDAVGALSGHRPFERNWMIQCIDQRIEVDSSRSQRRLDWRPRDRLSILRRLPFLVHNRRAHYPCWLKQNHVPAYRSRLRTGYKVHDLLSDHEDEILREFLEYLSQERQRERFSSYIGSSPTQLEDRHRQMLDQLLAAIRTGDKSIFMSSCQHMAQRWHRDGMPLKQLWEALEALGDRCITVINRDPEANALSQDLHDHITMAFQSAIDAVQEIDETMEQQELEQEELEHSRVASSVAVV